MKFAIALHEAGHRLVFRGDRRPAADRPRPADVRVPRDDRPLQDDGREGAALPPRSRTCPRVRRSLRALPGSRRPARHRPRPLRGAAAARLPRPHPAIGWSLCDMRRSARAATSATCCSRRCTPRASARSPTSPRRPAPRPTPACSRARGSSPFAISARSSSNGLWHAEGVKYVAGRHELRSRPSIDAADVVVAGDGHVPVAGDRPRRPDGDLGHTPSQRPTASPARRPGRCRRPERYRDYVRYPFDVADGPLDEILHAAARSEEPVAEWKRRFIGRPFDPQRFVALMERMVLQAGRAAGDRRDPRLHRRRLRRRAARASRPADRLR